ncbi:MAG: hypothetical protein NUV77_19420, partial [Thermoguttaceae bacterium]|nr:hypothetical protein [Thermoguttaceae bacterium]
MKAASVVRQARWAAAIIGLAVLAWALPCRAGETARSVTSSGQDVTADDSVEQAAFRPVLRRRPCPCPPQYTPAAPSAAAPAVPRPGRSGRP